MQFLKFRTYSLLSPRKSRPKIPFSNGTKFIFPDNLSNISPVCVVESFWFFVSSKSFMMDSFWFKLHVQKSSSSGVMAKKVNFEKSAKNGKNWGFSCFFSNSEHVFILIFFVKLESYRGLILVKTACSDHIRFFCCGLKQYQLIRLHISSKCIISRSAWQFELVFGLMCN